jgi:hypothetical protein
MHHFLSLSLLATASIQVVYAASYPIVGVDENIHRAIAQTTFNTLGKFGLCSYTGPCPLIAIANVLALEERIKLPETSIVEDKWILKELSMELSRTLDAKRRRRVKHFQKEGTSIPELPEFKSAQNYLENYNENSNLNLDPSIKGVSKFASEVCLHSLTSIQGARLFQSFGIPVYHAWHYDEASDESTIMESHGIASHDGLAQFIRDQENIGETPDPIARRMAIATQKIAATKGF